MVCIADKWEELSGNNNWDGLLQNLDESVRKIVINYGERVSATGYAFNDKSKLGCVGFSRYPPEDFFTNLGIQSRNIYRYNVTNFIYWFSDEESSWSAYVAVSSDEGSALLGRRDIVIAWRGTALSMEAVRDVQAFQVSASDLFGATDDPMVHYGFKAIYTTNNKNSLYNKTSARNQVLAEVRKLVDYYSNLDEEVSITVIGYSLGGAVAMLNAMDIASNGYNKPTGSSSKTFMVTAFLFATPRVGNGGFKKVFERLKKDNRLHILQIKNELDTVPSLPLNNPVTYEYVDMGVVLRLETDKSPYLKPGVDPHHIDVYLHGVAGTKGNSGGFNTGVEKVLDTALINRSMDGLVDKYNQHRILAKWWTLEIQLKEMVQYDDGYYRPKATFYVPDPPASS